MHGLTGFVGVAIVALLLVAAAAVLGKARKPQVAGLRPKPLLTDNEKSFFRQLEDALPRHRVFPQLAFAAFLTEDPTLSRQARQACETNSTVTLQTSWFAIEIRCRSSRWWNSTTARTSRALTRSATHSLRPRVIKRFAFNRNKNQRPSKSRLVSNNWPATVPHRRQFPLLIRSDRCAGDLTTEPFHERQQKWRAERSEVCE
jgi:hypothetical protein